MMPPLTCKCRFSCVPIRVNTRLAPPCVGVVEDVIVEQAGGVDHLAHQCYLPLFSLYLQFCFIESGLVLSSKCLEAYLIICWTTSCLQRCLAQTNRDHRSDSFSGAIKVIPDDQKGFLFASSNCVVATWLLLPTDWPQALIQSPILREYPWDAM